MRLRFRLPIRVILALSALIREVMLAEGQVPDQLKYYIPAPPVGAQTDARLGYSVALGDGYAVVGAPYDDSGATNSGVVKVFDSITGVLVFAQPNPKPALGVLFGYSVAISGTRVVVGGRNIFGGMSNPGSVYVYDLASGTPAVPIVTLSNPSLLPDDWFGSSVAISGKRIVVGAYGEDTGASNAGSAYLYDLDSATPTAPIATLHNPEPTVDDSFGYSVGIADTRVVVGVPDHSMDASSAGSAYVYNLNSALPTAPVATLNSPSPVPADHFGNSIAISGMRVVIGAPSNDAGAVSAGSAYVFDLSTAAPTVPVATLNNPSPVANDVFGGSVAISNELIVVGASSDDTGASYAGSVYVYDLSGPIPTVPVATLNNPSPAFADFFASSVAIAGMRVVVGAIWDDTQAEDAGSAYVYDLSSAAPTIPVVTLNTPSPATGDTFGRSVAISGTLLAVGAPYEDTGASDAGSAYVYDLSSATPMVPVVTLNNPSFSMGGRFGSSIAISGTFLVASAPNQGKAYIYDLNSGTPLIPVLILSNPSPAPGDVFGVTVATSGNRVVVGVPNGSPKTATNVGRVFVYYPTNVLPTVPVATLTNPNLAIGDDFGSSVAVSGSLVVVGAGSDSTGARSAGSAYVFDLDSTTPAVPVATLRNPSPAIGDWFGSSVAISGMHVVVGTSGDDTGAVNAGSAYVYDLSRATPTVPIATLNNPNPLASDLFGRSVAISGARVVVGAPDRFAGALCAGIAYVYDLSSGTPTIPVSVLNNPVPDQYDRFGSSVAIDGTTVSIGIPGDGATASGKGSACIFGPSPYSLWKVSELGNQFPWDFGDADGDGLSNLGEYGLLRSPAISEGAPFSAASAIYAEGERLRLFVPRDPARNDITLEVQATGNVAGPWTTIATSVLGAPFTGPGYFGGDSASPGVKSVEIRDVLNVTDSTQRFLRVRVQH